MATDDAITKKHSINPNSAVEQLDCSLDTLMDEARADEIAKSNKCFEPASEAEVIDALKDPNTQITMSTKTLGEILTNEDRKIAKQIFDELNKARWNTMDFSEPDNSEYGEHFDTWYKKDDVVRTIQSLKKKYGVD